MIEALLLAGLEGLTSSVGPVAHALIERKKTPKVGTLPGWSAVINDENCRHAVRRALLAEKLPDSAAASVTEFLYSPEGLLLARWVAIYTFTEQRTLTRNMLEDQAVALLTLFPPTRGLPPSIAASLVRVLTSTVTTAYGEIAKKSPKQAEHLREVAIRERRTRAVGDFEGSKSELWDLQTYNPAQLVGKIEDYCAAVASATSLMNIPSLQEERRLPLGEIYVGPTLAAGDFQFNSTEYETALIQALSVQARVVVLGDPGGGKSTLVQASINRLANAAPASSFAAIPIGIPLARYWREAGAARGGNSLVSFICAYLAAQELTDIDERSLRYLLVTGRCVVFFDGLDEILDLADRAIVRDRIEAFARRYMASSVVVTSRVAGYVECPLNTTEYFAIELPEFSDADVEAFVKNFISLSSFVPTERAVVAAEFLAETERVEDLRTNPLMLGLLCLLYEAGRTVPRNQAELYRDCAKLLFDTWDARRDIRSEIMEAAAAENAVSAVALRVFNEGFEEFSETWLRMELVEFYRAEHSEDYRTAQEFAERVVSHWRGRRWLLIAAGVRDGETYYKFAHRTFMEYFAAERISFECETPAELWSRISGLVLSRSATVFCLLAVQMFSRSRKGAGESILAALVAAIDGPVVGEAWNAAAFTSEVLLLLRAEPAAKDSACKAIVRLLVKLVPYSPECSPHQEASLNVLEGDEYVELDDAYEDAEGPEIGDGAPVALTFSGATLPLFLVARATGDGMDRLYRSLSAALLSECAGEETSRLRAIKMIIMLPILPFCENWIGLSDRQAGEYIKWASKTREEALRGSGWDSTTGDYWLDVYLARSGFMNMVEFVRRWGANGLLTGGWSLPIVGAPEEGTCLHAALEQALCGLSHGERLDEVESLLHCLQTSLMPWLSDGQGMYDVDLYEARSGLADRVALAYKAADPDCLSARARGGIVCALAALGTLGERKLVEAFERHPSGTMQALAHVAAVAVFRGDVNTAYESAVRAIDDDEIREKVFSAISGV